MTQFEKRWFNEYKLFLIKYYMDKYHISFNLSYDLVNDIYIL